MSHRDDQHSTPSEQSEDVTSAAIITMQHHKPKASISLVSDKDIYQGQAYGIEPYDMTIEANISSSIDNMSGKAIEATIDGVHDQQKSILAKLTIYRQEHRDLDDSIAALEKLGAATQLQIKRLKKRKLMLRDLMARLEAMIHPDIIA